jgi:hypothetical protein
MMPDDVYVHINVLFYTIVATVLLCSLILALVIHFIILLHVCNINFHWIIICIYTATLSL